MTKPVELTLTVFGRRFAMQCASDADAQLLTNAADLLSTFIPDNIEFPTPSTIQLQLLLQMAGEIVQLRTEQQAINDGIDALIQKILAVTDDNIR